MHATIPYPKVLFLGCHAMSADLTALINTELVIRPLSPTFAAEVIGLDLCRPLDATMRQTILDAFVRYQVLAFRDQSLSGEQQMEFSEQFGTLERHTIRNRGVTHPLLNVVTNLGPDGKPSGRLANQLWHSDKSFRPEPSMATILHAVIMPPLGGDTCFADMYASYETLADGEKAELEKIRVIHSWELSLAKSGRQATAEEIADAPPMSHPLVRVHPDSGRKCLFMGEHASHFEGQPMDIGRARLVALEAHATQEKFVYRHTWRAGDLLMWDNRCLLHRVDRNFDPSAHARVLHRTCLRGTMPL
ncbi:MAG: TauD/TfdA family dioxygenase [Acetobacteraceae bacterium]|nr:TauD/TfdA family dioxygenase [Acetobacteraceae bacterium]